MEVILGETAGFCYGVRHAVEGAKNELKNAKGKIYCLGEIVHNRQVVDKLKKNGMIFIENIKESKGKTILRAHGVAKEVYYMAKKNNIELKDYTCPNVLKIHEIAKQHANEGYYIFLCGNEKHPENIGTLSFCGKNVSVIETEDDVEKAVEELKRTGIKDLLLILQTTYSVSRFHKIEELLKEKLPTNINLKIKNTICRATELRQKETSEISKQVDYMIIIGGKNSSNTKKLFEIGKKNCKNCICIETASELPIEEIRKCEKIGVMAGASTPKELIEEVVNKLK